MSFYDYLGMLIGVTLSLLIMIYKVDNPCGFSILNVLRGGRRRAITKHFIFFYICHYLIAYFVMILVLLSSSMRGFNESTRHLLIPVLAALIPSKILTNLGKFVTTSSINPKYFGEIIKLINYLNEWILMFWSGCVSAATAHYKKKLLENSSNEEKRIIQMIFEKRKLAIAMIEKQPYILEADSPAKKCTFLFRNYGYNKLMELLNDGNYTGELECDFRDNWGNWDGTDRRNDDRYEVRRRISEQKHIRSSVEAGVDF